jgi:uncharacterized Zn-finger protein
MNLNRIASNQWLNRIVLAAWAVSAILVMFLLTKIDTIINSQLYNFGLQYNRAWANPYHTYTQMALVGLAVPIALSAFAIAVSFAKKTDKEPEAEAAHASVTKQTPKPQQQPVVSEERKPKEKENNGRENNNMVISCPNCKKVFSRPLVMLNFEGGKTRLMNVCPYCNHVLGSAEDEKSPEQDFQVADTDKKLIH